MEALHEEEDRSHDEEMVPPIHAEDEFRRDEADIRRDEERAQDEYMATFLGDENER